MPENVRLPRNIQRSFTCRKFTTWDRGLYFPSEGRRAEDFFALKNPTASVWFEPATLGTKGQHASSRQPKPQEAALLYVPPSCTEIAQFLRQQRVKRGFTKINFAKFFDTSEPVQRLINFSSQSLTMKKKSVSTTFSIKYAKLSPIRVSKGSLSLQQRGVHW